MSINFSMTSQSLDSDRKTDCVERRYFTLKLLPLLKEAVIESLLCWLRLMKCSEGLDVLVAIALEFLVSIKIKSL